MGGIKATKKSGAKPPRSRPAQKPPVPVTIQDAHEELDLLLAEAKIERKTQAAIMQQLLERHRGEVPVQLLTEQRAIRLMNNTCSGAELLARG
jgi:hypothetical protein